MAIGDVQMLGGKPAAAMAALRKLPLLQKGECSVALAALKAAVGSGSMSQNRRGQAIDAFPAS